MFDPKSHFAATQDTYWEFCHCFNKHAKRKTKFPVFLWPSNMLQIPKSKLLRDRQVVKP